MRTRQKFTAVGACTLAAGFIGGGALVTSSAMAADETTPDKGTVTVISMHDGEEAIKCTFENVDLPTIAFQPELGEPGTGGGFVVAGTAMAGTAITGTAITGEGPPEGGVVLSGTFPGDAPPPPGSGEMITVTAGEIVGDGPTFSTGGTPPEGAVPLSVFTFDDTDAREGTAEECAALEPGIPVPSTLTSIP